MTQITTLNASRARNFLINAGDSTTDKYLVYILGGFDAENTTELIGNLGAIVSNMPQRPIYNQKAKIVSPYDIDDVANIDENTPPIIDVFIDSNGGKMRILDDISTLLSMAKMRGAIIRTTVLSAAYSCGSLLAIQGTPGYRIMSQNAAHLIHFGSATIDVHSEKCEELAIRSIENHKNKVFSRYKNYTKIPTKILNETRQSRIDTVLNAEECLKHRVCDWILCENGQLKGRTR